MLNPKKTLKANAAVVSPTTLDFQMAQLYQLCRLEIPGSLLAAALFDALKHAIPCTAMTLVWQHAESSITRVFYESETEAGCGLADAQIFSPIFCGTGAELFSHLASEHRLRENIATAIPGVRHVMAQGFDTLAVYLVDTGKRTGAILLHRPRAEPFSTAEKAALVRWAPTLTPALNVDTDTDPRQFVTSESDAGILLLNHSMKIQFACCRGRKLFQLAQASSGNTRRTEGDGDLASRLHAQFDLAETARSSNFVFHNDWGSFEFFLHRLSDSEIDANPLTAVAIHRQEPLSLSVFRGCKKLALTTKQTDIALLLMQGLSYDAVATKLCVSATTVVDHVRKIYDKIGVSNRSELVTMLLLGAKKTTRLRPLPEDFNEGFRLLEPRREHQTAVKNTTIKGVVRGNAL